MNLPRALSPATRIESIDWVRGLAMVLMALDHARTYLADFRLDPLDLQQTSVALFLTRWITHFSAPVFIFLAGMSAQRLSLRLPPAHLTHALWLRGIWLVFLELTLMYFIWTFKLPGTGYPHFGVIWAIGWSMVLLGFLVRIPTMLLAISSLGIIVGHHVLDSLDVQSWGALGEYWPILHGKGMTPLGRVVYPLMPWVAVMASGFVAGGVFDWTPARRRVFLMRLGTACLVLFLALRLTNSYGDPHPWTPQPRPLFTLLSILNVEKYPPSLDFLLITLGCAFLLLAIVEQTHSKLSGVLKLFGRVPLFFYLFHLFVAHLAAGVVAVAMGFDLTLLAKDPIAAGWGFPLPLAYGVWLVMLTLLYPLCRWFDTLKHRTQSGWRRYL
ncbi:conserved membrane hypothetical protein [Candidatus Competibacter denitrificans Run_A_D11]|uniref:Heparan-alpha-glucosaminide N-acetyltransferase catalytic domain-containing protein n=1 Tax=Candidatus Competibacter denitrificans Run_A_D11 TaxID=1400863 RepID=W6MAX5_9GAMM|nr:heparan-alpha-glucosaminide N-acetyltransferase domain-containing protein [Candidatus Competibacter denitrificans]CDI03150.1 conserved membrane hypothetical protein [Candidatus Competibacter denitrificans Run_A_D11]